MSPSPTARISDISQYLRCPMLVYFDGLGLLNRSKYIERSKEEGIKVYWSLIKHGSYTSLKDAKKYMFIEGFKEPGSRAEGRSQRLHFD